MRVLFSPISSPGLVVGCFLDDCHQMGVRRNLSVVLIYISFMAKDFEHCFICLLTISIASFENSPLFSPFIKVFVFFLFKFLAHCIFLILHHYLLYKNLVNFSLDWIGLDTFKLDLSDLGSFLPLFSLNKL
jgi:hypothetical protein